MWRVCSSTYCGATYEVLISETQKGVNSARAPRADGGPTFVHVSCITEPNGQLHGWQLPVAESIVSLTFHGWAEGEELQQQQTLLHGECTIC